MANPEHVKLVLQPEDWNRWRVETSATDPDLSAANLRWVNLGGAHLGGADLSGADLSEGDLSEAGELATLFTNALCTIGTLRYPSARRLRRDGLRMAGHR